MCTHLQFHTSNMISVNKVINKDQTGPLSAVECLVQLVRKLGSVTVSNHLSLKFLIHILASKAYLSPYWPYLHQIGDWIQTDLQLVCILLLCAFNIYMVQCRPHVIL